MDGGRVAVVRGSFSEERSVGLHKDGAPATEGTEDGGRAPHAYRRSYCRVTYPGATDASEASCAELTQARQRSVPPARIDCVACALPAVSSPFIERTSADSTLHEFLSHAALLYTCN